MKYFVYCRKSTESEDRQIMSIDSQRTEIENIFGNREGIQIVGVFEEAYSAKAPGRPIFDAMLKKVERGEAEGLICWHPDRLARNSMDGGRIIYLLDQGYLRDLKFSTFSFENNSQGKFMLSIIFGYSKYYVDTLSENIKRGNRARLSRGWRPGRTPIGYRTDRETGAIVADGEHFDTVRRIFSLVLSGVRVRTVLWTVNEEWKYRLPSNRRHGARPLSKTALYRILGNLFYTGRFMSNGKLHQGKHPPLIGLREFQQVQALIGRPGTEKPQTNSFPLTGLIRCGACGLMVTAENKVNRFGSRYTYYHCTKRRVRGTRCTERSIESKNLLPQIVSFLQRVNLPQWHVQQLSRDILAHQSSDSTNDPRTTIQQQLSALDDRSTALDDGRLRKALPRDEYISRVTKVELERAKLLERLHEMERKPNWFEPAHLIISFQRQAISWFLRGTDEVKRLVARAIGSNLSLKGKKLLVEAKKPFSFTVEESICAYRWRYLEYVRTQFESQDPEFLLLLDQIRTIKAMVEEADRKEPRLLPVDDAPGSKRDGAVQDSELSLRRMSSRRRPPSSADGSPQLFRH